MSSPETNTRWPYVIVSDCDAPAPNMVCQWVPGIGYCYLDRSGNKPNHDGMQGLRATPVEDFGLVWVEDAGGTVSFYRSERPEIATYSDGEPRRWQHRGGAFTYRRLTAGAVQRKKESNV